MAIILDANTAGELIEVWTLPSAARLGSSVRSKGIYLEIRARLPVTARKSLTVKAGELTLRMPRSAFREFSAASAVVSKGLDGIERLPVIPREIQDILTISATERHRWLKDGRLRSAGTRTVKLRGRAKKVTFHVFDPRYVEELLDRDLVAGWREDDATRAAANRRLAAERRALRRTQVSDKKAGHAPAETPEEAERHNLKGWEEFERTGLLR